ncbi:MAG: WD40 repeat domain-containing protein [Chthoniobacterales bacterium]
MRTLSPFPLLLSCLALLSAAARAQEKPVPSDATLPLADLRGVWNADFNHDASRVFVRMRGGTVGLWDATQGTPIAGDLPAGQPSKQYVMSPDAKRVLVGFADGSRVFDTTSAAAISPLLEARLSDQLFMSALFAPDGGTVLIFESSVVSVWDVHRGESLARIPMPVEENEDVSPAAAFTADGARCFILDRHGLVTCYDAKTWQPLGKPMQHPAAEMAYQFGCSVSPDGKWLATFDDPGENGPKSNLQLWDASLNKPLGKPLVAVNGFHAEFLPRHQRVLIAPARGEAHVRELPSLRMAFKARPHDDVSGPSVAVSPDEKWILTWGADRRIDVYDAATGKLVSNHLGSANISKVMLAPDSASCYVAFDNTAFLLQKFHDHYIVKFTLPDLAIGAVIRLTEYLNRSSLSLDGRRLLVMQGATEEESITIYETDKMTALEWPAP